MEGLIFFVPLIAVILGGLIAETIKAIVAVKTHKEEI